MALSAGTRLGPYEILEPLGAGGMGEVYRARDPRLKREVALKVLPAELASERERLERFEREAQALAALSHPHIVTIFSVEEAAGVHFLTMELVEGKTLAQAIPRGGLSLSRFFQIAIPLAEAVSAAHEKGITHRDLKPGNVMVTGEGRVKVLDFGLAKLRHEAAATEDSEAPTVPATEAGRVLGTAPYMSPEQVQGQAVDHRSDVFSLGIMLYEMATGVRPFAGDTSAELASSILRDTPASVTERKADLPRDLGKLIKHCLEKEPKKRFQSTLDLANELEDLRREVDTGEAPARAATPVIAGRPERTKRLWLVGAVLIGALAVTLAYLQARSRLGSPPLDGDSVPRKRLVVLPFENLGAPEDAYFAAGMTEEITNRLARVSGLGVISRTSAVQYDPTGKDVKQIGQDFGVGFVLEGTVRWDRQADGGGRVRISPQLIRVADDTHLWADSYDRVLDDVFAVQSEIAEAVARQLGVALLPEERRAVEARPTDSLEAYQAYLRGLEHWWDPDQTRQSQELAVQMFGRAVEHDPTFVEAHASLAQAHISMYDYDKTPERLAQARDAVDRALALDPASPDAHLALGRYHEVAEGDRERALEEYTFVAGLRPNDSTVAYSMALVLRSLGRFDEAIAQLERALELDPRNAQSAARLAGTYRFLARYSEAERLYDVAISLAPDKAWAYTDKANSYQEQGRLDRARATLDLMPQTEEARHTHTLWIDLERRDRNYQAALDHLAAARTEERVAAYGLWKEVAEGDLYRLMKQPERARACYEAAVAILEDAVSERPDDVQPHLALANAYAGLGRKAEALREAARVMELSPISKDAHFGTASVLFLPEAYTTVGEHEAALDLLESLASIPSWMSYGYLRFEPNLDPLRDDPRFQKLLADKKKQLTPR